MNRVFTTREKVLLLVFVIILMAAGYYWVIEQPVSERISAAASAEAGYQDEMMTETVKAKQIKDMKAVLDAGLDGQSKPVSAIPDYDNLENVMVQLDAILTPALDYSLTFSDVQPDGKLISRPISMTFKCDGYTAAKNIVDNLYHSIYRCTLDNITMTASAKDRDGAPDLNKDQVSVSLTVTFYERNVTAQQ